MTEMVTSGLMRGCWRRSDGPLEGDTRPKRGETARPRTPCTPPRQRPTLLVIKTRELGTQIGSGLTQGLQTATEQGRAVLQQFMGDLSGIIAQGVGPIATNLADQFIAAVMQRLDQEANRN
jgi:hypothetical protein